MSTKGTVGVAFCLDASASMRPRTGGVKSHIASFDNGLKGGGQQSWNLRLDYVANRARKGVDLRMESLCEPNLVEAIYQPASTGQNQQGSRLFTRDIQGFKQGLSEVKTWANEASLVAQDSCLDFPWRPSCGCHRAVVFMTDETTATGIQAEDQRSKFSALMQKIMDLRVMLFVIGLECPFYEEISEVDKSEHEVVAGLSSINFINLLAGIGKSASVSQASQQSAKPTAQRELYGQRSWVKAAYDKV
jgi:hypothetical protein